MSRAGSGDSNSVIARPPPRAPLRRFVALFCSLFLRAPAFVALSPCSLRIAASASIALLALPCLLSGCSGPSRSSESWFNRKSPRQWLDIALEHPQPDERRKAVAALANGPEGGADWAAAAFDSIARTDPDGMVRAAAVRGLARSADGRTVPTLIKLLNSNDARLDDTLPAPGAVRWEAALLLEQLHERDAVPPVERDSVLAAVLMRADRDPDRNVRLSALSMLGRHKDARVFPVLIAALQSRDFAIQRRAEHALYRLTGQSHELDAAAWHEWLSKTADPFAQAPTASAPQPTKSIWRRLFGGA